MVLGIAGVLAAAAPAFAVPTYNGTTQTLTYPNGDLDPVVDPIGNASDVTPAQQFGIPLPVYNSFGPRVVHFNDLPTASGAPGPVAKIVAHYDPGDASKTVTITAFHAGALGFGGNSPFGLIHTSEVANDAGGPLYDDVFNGGPGNGSRPWVPISPVQPPNYGLAWFGCDIAWNDPNALVDSFAFTACGQATGNLPTKAGTAYFLLTDGTYGVVPYLDFGGPAPQLASIAYQAPLGLGILKVDVIAEAGAAGGSVQFTGMDDFGFTVVQEEEEEEPINEPAGLGLLGLMMLARRKRRS
jgi:hypothetical protein